MEMKISLSSFVSSISYVPLAVLFSHMSELSEPEVSESYRKTNEKGKEERRLTEGFLRARINCHPCICLKFVLSSFFPSLFIISFYSTRPGKTKGRGSHGHQTELRLQFTRALFARSATFTSTLTCKGV